MEKLANYEEIIFEKRNAMYITVTGFSHYYSLKPFSIGNLVMCRKDGGNPYDHDAIKVCMPLLGTVGFIANSIDPIAGGTMSAGRIYDKMPDRFYATVLFTTRTKVNCDVSEGVEADVKAMLEEV